MNVKMIAEKEKNKRKKKRENKIGKKEKLNIKN